MPVRKGHDRRKRLPTASQIHRRHRDANRAQRATNKTKVLAKSEPLLNEIADVLKENPTIKISIEGHTDSTGRYKSNVKLSQGRAKSVMQELIKRGIAKDRLQYAGYGPDKPIDTNDTPEGRANNRRVELRITER